MLPLALYPPTQTATYWGYNPNFWYSLAGGVTSYSSVAVPEPSSLAAAALLLPLLAFPVTLLRRGHCTGVRKPVRGSSP